MGLLALSQLVLDIGQSFFPAALGNQTEINQSLMNNSLLIYYYIAALTKEDTLEDNGTMERYQTQPLSPEALH